MWLVDRMLGCCSAQNCRLLAVGVGIEEAAEADFVAGSRGSD